MSGRTDLGKELPGNAYQEVALGAPETKPTMLPGFGQPEGEAPEVALTLAERWEAYDKAHPEVYEAIRQLAYDWKRRTGRDRLGIAALFEVARWQLSIQTGETPSLNNSFRSFLARKLMREEPGLDGLFETRRSVADETLDLAS